MKTNKKQDLIKITFVKQHSQFSCGLACLTSIIKFYAGETLNKLHENIGTFLNGTSLLGLYQTSQKLGFEIVTSKTGGHYCRNKFKSLNLNSWQSYFFI
jgi:ATP-binding cassette, subfamily C, bacteriocin exporter